MRYYGPEIGLWTSRDPLERKTIGISPYHFVMNNPIGNIDLFGMESVGSKCKNFNIDDVCPCIAEACFCTDYSYKNGKLERKQTNIYCGYCWAPMQSYTRKKEYLLCVLKEKDDLTIKTTDVLKKAKLRIFD